MMIEEEIATLSTDALLTYAERLDNDIEFAWGNIFAAMKAEHEAESMRDQAQEMLSLVNDEIERRDLTFN